MQQKNATAVRYLKLLGYPTKSIRQALRWLTGIHDKQIADQSGFSRPKITHNINGARANISVQMAIAEIWNVPREEIFENARHDPE